jgi:CRISPR system Cascade subunit CasC
MPDRFLQIHTLTSYPASLLNRDDAGFAKRMPFGGAVRTRISSQCLKRHWRTYEGDHSLSTIGVPESVRSRVAFERYIVTPLIDSGVPDDVARRTVQKLVGKVFGSEAKLEKADKRGKKQGTQEAAATVVKEVETKQVTVVGRPELEYLRQLAAETIASVGAEWEKVDKALDARVNEKELKENLVALGKGAGWGAALFGRMVTGDVLSRVDAPIHVAHALTVHGQMTESDYFTAIDDLRREEGEQGSGHINASELTSGLFYGYIVVDLNLLESNLGGDRALVGEVVERLIHIVPTVTPGAKKGSTAPYAYSHLVLVEAGSAQPRTLQNAFLVPVRAQDDIVERTYTALRQHLADLDEMYGKSERRSHAGLRTSDLFENRKTLADLAAWAKAQVVG